ncbi:hypothetical protein O6H91_19G044000 [Diphasiastrum complanatum]|uniref:Uncharacterized protein n=2 Tax=Diphasiastrum complanatum TaxID=34168 RepID=A0ACC2AUS0_DIPCM|nr:hypothetical protein O6H91_19G044000 [Diphasiastrum complanatum]KAJ7521258.1 hypothetical protein O6H91_19G044000 [Diphasiastrum complanatum]
MVQVLLKTAGCTRRHALHLASPIEVRKVRELVAAELGLSEDKLKLVAKGKALQNERDGELLLANFVDGDSILAIVAPEAPSKQFQRRYGGFEDDDEDLRFKLPETANRVERFVAAFLREKLKVPDIVLMVIYSIGLRAWLLIVIWFTMAPILHQWDLGPLYVLVTAFCLIMFNLGKRREGEVSAYSIFNEGFRELPGTLNAERLDRDLRAGLL